jgi:TonB family protein
VHYLSKRARLERECACDDFVVEASGSAYEYAQALTGLALARHDHATVALAATGGNLLPRLRYLAGDCIDEESLPRNPLRLALLTLTALLLGFGAAQEPWQRFIDKPVAVATQVEVAQRKIARAPEPVTTPSTSEPIVAERSTALPENTVLDESIAAIARPRASRPVPTYRDVVLSDLAMPEIGAPPVVSVEEPGVEAPSEPANLEVNELSVSAAYDPMPEYPSRARLEGIEGEVSAIIRVGPDGRANGLQIVSAEPIGVFEGAVRRALMQWRYDVASLPTSTKNLAMSYQLHFKLSGVASTATGICATATASRTCSPH